MSRQIRVEIKPGVILWPAHFHSYHIGLILKGVEAQWPEESDLIVITRGAEAVPTGAPRSKHLIGKAFDFRTKHLPSEVDREALVKRILNESLLGMDYWGYWKKTEVTEWMHIHYAR